MCLAMPMKINKIDGSSAECEAGGLTQNIRIDFIKDPKPGDYVMVRRIRHRADDGRRSA